MPRLLGRVRAISTVVLAAALLFHLASGSAAAQIAGKSVTLIWTATGDNGLAGRAAKYDLRYSGRTIAGTDTASWWSTASIVNMNSLVPSPSGARDSAVVAGLVVGKIYYAMLRVGDSAGNWSGFSNVALIDLMRGITAVEEDTAPKLVIGAPYPSPTSGAAQLSLTLSRPGPLSADVYDVRGRRVRTLHAGALPAGPHVLRWDGATEGGAPAAAGVYWIRVSAEGTNQNKKLIVVR